MSAARILYVITDLETGGVPLHLYRLATSLDRTRFDPLVVSLAPPGPVSAMLEADGVPTHACGARGPLDLAALWRLRRIIRRFQPDLIHALLFHANIAVRLVGRLPGVPRDRIITEIQTVEIERPWHLIVDQLTHGLCRCQIGNSPAVIDHLVHRAALPRDFLVCIPGGVDPARFQNVIPADRSAWEIPPPARLLIWVGRMDPIKGLDYLLEALVLLPTDPPTHLLLVGDGPERSRTEVRADRLGLRHRVHFTGFRQDIPALLAAADLFVFPSLTEGMPNALLEAMAAGLPVIACDVPGCRELIDNTVNGFLVPPRSSPAIAGAVARLLAQPVLARRLGQAASRAVLRHYSQHVCHANYAALYAQILGQPNSHLPPH
ncbi:MAG: glycosyltransferase [Phycisphaerales bacterium]|nr:MAG: glycosyltransferase [Phycisphaerales bacterium]